MKRACLFSLGVMLFSGSALAHVFAEPKFFMWGEVPPNQNPAHPWVMEEVRANIYSGGYINGVYYPFKNNPENAARYVANEIVTRNIPAGRVCLNLQNFGADHRAHDYQILPRRVAPLRVRARGVDGWAGGRVPPRGASPLGGAGEILGARPSTVGKEVSSRSKDPRTPTQSHQASKATHDGTRLPSGKPADLNLDQTVGEVDLDTFVEAYITGT